MKKLTLEQLSIYLPYKLKIKFDDEDIAEIVGLELNKILLISRYGDFGRCDIGTGKLLLHSINKVLESPFVDELYQLYGAGYPSIRSFNNDYYFIIKNIDLLDFNIIRWLAKKHIDIFGLIEQGLAEEIK